MTGPVTDDERARVSTLHAQGLSRNDIARELDRSGRTISRIANELGLRFDREATRAATAAKKADAAERRTALALALLGDAEQLRETLWAPTTVYAFGGRDNVFASEVLDQPDAATRLKILQATGVAVDRSLRLTEFDRDTSAEDAKSMLAALATGLGTAYRQLKDRQHSHDGEQPAPGI